MRRGRSVRIALVIGVIAIVGVAILYINAMSGEDLGYDPLPVSPLLPIVAFGENALCYDSQKLLCLSAKGEIVWSYDVGDPRAEFSATNQDIVIWNGSQLHILGRDGQATYSTQIDREIKMARAGEKYTAVRVTADIGTELRIIGKQGEAVDTLTFPYELLDCGFFDQGDKLWTLSLDVSGMSPESYIGTYQPGVREMGKVHITTQLMYGVFPGRTEMLLLGTQQVNSSDFYGKLDDSKSTLVYGWELLTRYLGTNIALVFGHPEEMGSSPPSITGVRVIHGSEDFTFRFPAEMTGALAGPSKIYGFTRTVLVSCDYSGGNMKSRALPFPVDRVVAYLEKDKAVVVSGGQAYVLSLE